MRFALQSNESQKSEGKSQKGSGFSDQGLDVNAAAQRMDGDGLSAIDQLFVPSPPSPLSRTRGEGELSQHDQWNAPRPPQWERGWGEGTQFAVDYMNCSTLYRSS